MADPEPRQSTAGTRRPWVVGIVALVLFLAAAAFVIVAVPRGGSTTQRSPFAVGSVSPAGKSHSAAAVELRLTVDSLQASAGGVQARVMAIPGTALPRQGATLFSSIGSLPTMVIRPDQLDQERTVFLASESGDVANYPFDSYRVAINMVALAGTDTSVSAANTRTVLPLEIEGQNTAAGTVISATTRAEKDDVLTVTLTVRRSLVSRGWVLAMMAIYWALAILAASITYLVLRGRRPMETRLLAWLSAMVFALIAFRTAAPGAPPVGTFLDYCAVFESVGIVAAALVALMIFYLVARPERL